MKAMKKVLAGLLAAAIAVTCTVPAYAADGSPVQPPSYEDGKGTANINGGKITGETNTDGTMTVTKLKSDKKDVKVAATQTINGVEYTVTTIDANAFKNCKKMKTVTLPKTTEQINKNAFAGARKLKTITLKITKNITVKKGAFKGLNTKKMTIKVGRKMSKKQLKKFKKTLEKAGFNGKVKKA